MYRINNSRLSDAAINSLEGDSLDGWVALAMAVEHYTQESDYCLKLYAQGWLLGVGSPSEDWLAGGPLIDEYDIHFSRSPEGLEAYIEDAAGVLYRAKGDTRLEAACRAFVKFHFGE